MSIFHEIIKARYWFLPTREESFNYEKEFKQKCIDEIPEIQNKIRELQKKGMQIEKIILESKQGKNYMDLKDIHQDILFQNTRLNHHLEEQIKNIKF